MRLERVRRLVVLLLVGAGAIAFALHLAVAPPALHELTPATTYRLDLDIRLEAYGDETRVRTFLPVTDERQLVLDEEIDHGRLLFSSSDVGNGREARWVGERVSGPQQISYRATIVPRGVKYELGPELIVPREVPRELEPYLSETETIQVGHREIGEALRAIAPESGSAKAILDAIFAYTHEAVDGAEFKGTTDALTALRLGKASCNGKSRLFVALARRAGLPARLAGGLILKSGQKKTSHQWVEVRLGNHWVPFCPTNGHYAKLPYRYLRLYRGDQALFTHTRNINFDYLFDIERRMEPGAGIHFASAGYETAEITGTAARLFGAGHQVSRIFLLFPLAALIVIVMKNVVGFETFGVFLPMLIAAACRHTGLVLGVGSFLVVVVLAALVSRALDRLRVLQAPRLSVLISVITLTVLGAVALMPDAAASRIALLGMFPPVILGFTGERLSKLSSRRDWLSLVRIVASTVLVIVVCYAAFGSVVLQTFLVGFPELLLPIVAAQMVVGRWTGLRLMEHWRFGSVAARDASAGSRGEAILGINARNIEVLDRLNPPELIEVADDKLLTKQALESSFVPVPATLAVVSSSADVQGAIESLEGQREFVIKPAHGAAGDGILVVAGRSDELYVSAGGALLDADDLRRQLTEILAGVHSDGHPDQAFVEERIVPDAFFRSLAGEGLADVRVLLVRGGIVAAMLRLPTVRSGGRANLHQGAVGVPVEIETGATGPGRLERRVIVTHPDTGCSLLSRTVPRWAELLGVARMAQRAIPLGYIGVDLCVDLERGPLVLEVNARPGLEIQNVQGRGLWPEIHRQLRPEEGGHRGA